MNKNWPRWIFASISKHFYDRRQGIEMFIEGQHREDPAKELFELRISGPEVRHLSYDAWELVTEINVLIQAVKSDTNFHRIHELSGIILDAFTDHINVKKYGNNSQDDGSLLGCMDLIQEDNESVEVVNYGQTKIDVKLVHTTVQGSYRLWLPQ